MPAFSWLPFTAASVILIGVSMAFYKLPAVRKLHSTSVAFWALIAPAIFSFFSFAVFLPQTNLRMLLLAFLWGSSFAAISALQMAALLHTDATALFPVTATLSVAATVTLGIVFLGEHITVWQTIGTAIILFSVFSFLYRRKLPFSKPAALFAVGIIALSPFNKVVQKIAADSVDIQAFQIWQYTFGALFLTAILLLRERNLFFSRLREGAKSGILIGIFSFLGGYAFLLALERGPISLISPVFSLYTFVTAAIAFVFFRERLTFPRVLLLFIAAGAVFLLRIG